MLRRFGIGSIGFLGAMGACFVAIAAPPAARKTPDSNYAFCANGPIITAYQVERRTGALVPLPNVTTVVPGRHAVTLVAHPSGRYLYCYPTFDADRDGYPRQESGVPTDPARRTTTALHVYQIEKGGRLIPLQKLVVPALVGDLKPHPGGQFLYAFCSDDVAQVLQVRKDGTLHRSRSLRLPTGISLQNEAGTSDDGDLVFSLDGHSLYDYRRSGFLDSVHSELHRFRVLPNGGFLEADAPWRSGSGHAANAARDPGWVVPTAYATALVFGSTARPSVCPVDTSGRLVATGSSPSVSSPRAITRRNIAVHPRYPLLYLAFPGDASYGHVWRITAPGKVESVSTFASAFATETRDAIVVEPTGQYLYEFGLGGKYGSVLSYAVFHCAKDGSVILSRPPTACPTPMCSTLCFTSIPATVKK